MNNELIIEASYQYGRTKALELRAAAPGLTDTEVIDQELFIPHWKQGLQEKDAPLQYEGQVYRVLQAHDSTENPDWVPSTQPALFSICHTKNPLKAKPWKQPQGISGMYQLGDCYIDDNEIVWRQIFDGDNVYDAATLPERWKQVDFSNNNVSENFDETTIPEEPITSEEPEIIEDPEETTATEEPEIPEVPEILEEPDEPETLEEWVEWVQPTGSHDAYSLGAKVTHNEKYWVNTGKDNNEYEPGIWGWEEFNLEEE